MNNTAVTNTNNAHLDDDVVQDDKLDNLNDTKVTDNTVAKSILLYKNGDKFFPPKRFVVNKRYIRTWDSFLEELTKSIQPRSGAIRDIRTPFHGTKIKSLDDLLVNGKYVAIPKGEVLKLIDYTNVVDVTSPSSQTKKELPRLKPLKPLNNETDKVETKGNSQLNNKGIIIYVYRNGDPFTRGIKILLNQFEQKHMSILVRAIEERVLLPSNRPIRRLYTMEGEIIKFAKNIENGQYYVAASNEQFDNIKYGQYLPAIRAGKVPPKTDYNAESSRQKPVTSRTQKKEKDEKETAAIKIQAAFRGYFLRKQFQSAQENNEPLPHSMYRYQPKIVKLRSKPIKQVNNENKSKERYHSVERKVEAKESKTEKKNESTITKEVSKKDQEKKIQKEKKEEVKVVEKKKEIKKPAEKREEKKVAVKEKNNVKDKKEENTSDNANHRNLAAAKIQAGFRGYFSRELSGGNQRASNVNENSETIKSEDKIAVNDSKIEEKDQVEEKQNDSNINSEKERENAAIKIQMGFRGYKTRKTMKEREQAANVIQSSYKGYKTRKYMSDKRENNRKEKAAGTIQAYFRSNKSRNARLETTARNNAAITIQAAFKGYRVREAIKQ